MKRRWRVTEQSTLHDRFYRVDSISFEHELHAGGMTPTLERELFVRGNVVGVLPYDPVNDCVVLVEQFRIGAMHQQPHPWMLEIIAGMVDTDETPNAVAIREAQEEAGVSLSEVQLISHYLASPGSSTEEVFVFHAETDLSQVKGLHGLADEDEDIRVHVVPAEEAIAMLETRRIRNALSIIALQWLQLRRRS